MSVLQRKAQAGKQEHQARAMTVPKALRVSIAKVADELFDLPLAVIGAVQEKCSAGGLAAKMDEAGLLVFLDGPGGLVAGAILGPEFVGALVQQQTTGRVTAQPPAERKLTATDAALCAPMLDAVFQRAHDLLETPDDRHILAPYRFGAKAESKRVFLMSLDQPDYHVLRLTLDVAAGAFQSVVTLLLPKIDKPAALEPEQGDASAPVVKPTLEKTVLSLHAELTAVLARVRLPWSDLERLSPGDEITIPLDAFDTVELVAPGGRRIGSGAMGQVDGMRALQVDHRPVEPNRPQRRASDRDEIDQPHVAPMGNRLPAIGVEARNDALDHAPLDMPDLPPLDLPDLDLTPAPAEDTAFELPDLPDFSDLPELGDFNDLDDFPKMNSA